MSARSIKKKEQVTEVFKKYLPEAFVEMVVDLFIASTVRFKIVNGRRTKLGDFRAGQNGEKHQISVNGDLNPYSFLITTPIINLNGMFNHMVKNGKLNIENYCSQRYKVVPFPRILKTH
jgi:hypothetical protein